MSKPLVLITDAVHSILVDGLQQIGFEVHYRPDLQAKEVAEIIQPYTGLIVNSKVQVSAQLMDQAPNLAFTARIGSGLEVIDLPAAEQRNIKVYSAPEGNCNAVAEQALGMLLMQLNHLARAHAQVREDLWEREPNRGHELSSRTVGIIAFGHTGSRFAQLLQGFGCRILVYDKYKPAQYAAQYPHVSECKNPDEVLRQADILSLHLPLTSETKHWLNAERIAQLPKGAIVINTSRGTCLHTPSLIAALESGHLAGACLDVLENEKPNTYTPEEKEMYQYLYNTEQVVLSPHIAGWTHESKIKLAQVLLQKIAADFN